TATIYRDNNDFTPEVFNGNPPSFSYYTYEDENKNYGLLQPWNYNKTYNSSRDYPLVVYLHGSGGSWIASGIFNNDDFKRKYPSFVYIPHTMEHSWDNNMEVMSRIEDLKNKYRIDINRIYLIGYSMGGSGSYLVAHDYFDYNNSGNLFAGIIRLAGKSQTKLRKEIADRTSVWLHFGLKDTLSGVRESVRGAYDYLKNYYGITEIQTSVTIPDHPGTTYTLTKDNIEIVKKTEYDNDGHDINSFPFNDPYLLEWLFSQSLKNRP
ncbi:MAG: hypothetical protein GXP33_09785, partial [Spirochaetes bacterium]|nr:hypothetical protein [Spirochaetota bacterium]